MTERVRCSNTEPHNFHEHHQDVAVSCSGQTRCGEQTHEPHTFVENQRLWCDGICPCGLDRRGGLHGPGAHK